MDDLKSIPDQADITERLIGAIKKLSPRRQSELLDALETEKPGETLEGELRLHSRKDILLPVDYASYDKCFRDFARDISEGGVFIETKQPLMAGQKIAMTFMATDNQHHFKINGKIVRDVKDGIGVKFDKTTSEQIAQIKAFLSTI